VGDDAIEELGERVYGVPLPKMLGAAWASGGFAGITHRGLCRTPPPVARLLGLVSAHDLLRTLVTRYDEDWFSNPHAEVHLANIAVGPIHRADVPAEEEGARLGRHYEERLG
jgi:hypothetical protein